MKSFISVIILAALFTTTLLAQAIKDDAVPGAISQAFKQKFPSAIKPEWKISKDKNYEAEFTENSIKLTVKFSPDGKWLETKSGIGTGSVPEAIKNAVGRDFSGYKITESQRIETADSKEPVYEIRVKKDKEVLKLHYSKEGKLLKKSGKKGK
jgi:hypothetical protein